VSEDGFTLIEVIVTALLVALISSAVATSLIATAITAGYQRHRAQAGQIAEQDQQRLRGLSAEQLSGLDQNRVVTLDGTGYQVNSTATFLSSSGVNTCGAPGAGAAAYFRVASTVNWPGNIIPGTGANREPPVVAESVITPPAGGTLVAQVVDPGGVGLPGVAVAANGPSYESGVTDAGGCTELAALSPGSYTATFTDPGYVDQSGNASPTSAATVTATGTSRPTSSPISMGLAGTVNATFTALGTAGNLTGQEANALAWFGNGQSSRMSEYETYPSTCASQPSTCTTAASVLPAAPNTVALFPFQFTGPSYAGNYQVWAGPCLQMEPPSTVDKFTVGPGSNQTLQVQEPALDILAEVLGVRVLPVSVSLTFQSTSGTPCSVTWHPAIAANALTNLDGVLASPGQPFASTATSGATASASGYTGTYTLCVSASVLGITRKVTISNITNNNLSIPTVVTPNLTLTSQAGSC
jgi:prepilin-type N-terminal cleavage/methylation domain-containing protein